ncbi:hypothetical protein, partial [Phyllobacterium brassicacearum]|uniref:hypothetical protein n=1 Tax=Phyllobacterium brassicacearum TaxID=314235 RepID=UPI001AECD59D
MSGSSTKGIGRRVPIEFHTSHYAIFSPSQVALRRELTQNPRNEFETFVHAVALLPWHLCSP